MDASRLYILVTFVVSAACGFASIPFIVRYCKRKGIVDTPQKRKVHTVPVPRLGGACFLPSMGVAAIIALAVFNQEMGVEGKITVNLWACYFVMCLTMIYAVGFVDDYVGVSAKTKFVVQTAAAAILPLSGLYLNTLYGLFGIHDIPAVVGMPLTVLVIVFINNAVNLIDGIDGLCASLALIALGGFIVLFTMNELTVYSVLIAGLMGVLASFLFFNVCGKDTKDGYKIFMGDSGSLTIGFILAFLLVKISMARGNAHFAPHNYLLLASTLLTVPCLDVLRVMAARVRHGRPVFDADKNHIHHKLLRAGLGQRGALITVVALQALYIAVNVSLCDRLDINVILIIDIAVWLLFHAVLNRKIRERGERTFSI